MIVSNKDYKYSYDIEIPNLHIRKDTLKIQFLNNSHACVSV